MTDVRWLRGAMVASATVASALVLAALQGAAAPSAATTGALPALAEDRGSEDDGLGLTALPVSFIPNAGQLDPAVRFEAVLGDSTLFVTRDGLVRVDDVGQPTPAIQHIAFDDATRDLRIVAGERLPGVAHFLIGDDPSRWVTHVPTYASVTVRGFRPGMDLRLKGKRGAVELELEVEGRENEHAEPLHLAWQREGGRAEPLRLERQGEQAAAAPALVYSTFLGGRLNEMVRGLAVDAEGFAYMAGTTTSVDFPTVQPLQPEIGNSGSLQDAFVAKINPEGTALVYSTFFGGSRQDEAFGLAIDRVGRAHITGYTTSENFPAVNALQPEVHLSDGIFSGDAFVAKLRPDGDGLEFSTPWGGTSRDIGKGIAVDPAGYIYVTGWTGSNFPAVNAIYPLNRGVRDAFLMKLAPAGDQVVYSTHLGGSYGDEARRIAVDPAGNAYIVGTTESLNLRVTAPYQRVISGDTDAFVAKINSDGSAFAFATYLGGRGNERGIDIAVNPAGEAYVLSYTDSPDFPRQDPLQPSRAGPSDLAVTRFTPAGDALVFSTYLGGNGDEGDCVAWENPRQLATATPDPRGIRYLEGSKFTDGPVGGIAVDAAGRVHVTSCTSSSNLRLVNPIQTSRAGAYAILLGVLDPPGAALVFSTYLGGRSMNVPRALALGNDGGIYVAGQTDATDFPLAPAAGPLQGARRGTDDAFVLKVGAALEDAPTVTPVATEEATATEAATVTSTASATGAATATATSATPTASASHAPTIEPSATPGVERTPTPEHTATPRATDTVQPSATATPTSSPTATPIARSIWLPVAYAER